MEVRTHLVYEFLCSDEPPKKLAMPLVFQESPTLPQLRATTSKRTSIKISSTISWVQTWMKVSNMSWQHLQIRKCQYKKGVPVLLKDFGTVFWKSTLQVPGVGLSPCLGPHLMMFSKRGPAPITRWTSAADLKVTSKLWYPIPPASWRWPANPVQLMSE